LTEQSVVGLPIHIDQPHKTRGVCGSEEPTIRPSSHSPDPLGRQALTVPASIKADEPMECLELSAKRARLLFRQGAPLPRILPLFIFSSLERHCFVHSDEV
jgi:hypothetical protein